MNRNKKIFIVILVLLLLWTIILVFNALFWDKQWNKIKEKTRSELVVWLLYDDASKFRDFFKKFKEKNKQYKNENIIVETFYNYDTYFYSLASAFSKWVWPDIFVLNNNEKSVLEEHVIWINPSIISPNDFRKRYKWVFADDLIQESKLWKKDFLVWIPIWYESLGIFYNRRYFRADDFKTWWDLENKIADMNRKWDDIIPLWIWNWSTVALSYEIITQLFILDWAWWLANLSQWNMKKAMDLFFDLWNKIPRTPYNSILQFSSSKNNLDLFSKWEISAIIWFPRTLEEIDRRWYWENFLLATPFPRLSSKSKWKTFINYNYFVINKNSLKKELSTDILKYMFTKEWSISYLNKMSYYLPAMMSLEDVMVEWNINPDYNIVYKNFYDRSTVLTSFDKWNKLIYDNQIINLLDAYPDSYNLLEKFKNKLICLTKKSITLQNLSTPCE